MFVSGWPYHGAFMMILLLHYSIQPLLGCLLCSKRIISTPRYFLGPGGSSFAPLNPDSSFVPLKILSPLSIRRGTSKVMAMSAKDRNREDETDTKRDSSWQPAISGNEDNNDNGNNNKNEEEEGLQKLMLNSIRWYKSQLSPLMPPNCRFLPTCSSYGMDAIKRYGPVKGGALTAWRIMRCTPLGGSGYDAPVWPPPGYRAGSNTKPWF